MDKRKVFISYSSSDAVWAREFANSLQQRGLKVWFDSNAIHSGQSLTDAVEKGLRESSVIALLVTPDTIKRPNLFFEIGAAMGMGKPLIPEKKVRALYRVRRDQQRDNATFTESLFDGV